MGIISSGRVAGACREQFQREGGTRVVTGMEGWREAVGGWMDEGIEGRRVPVGCWRGSILLCPRGCWHKSTSHQHHYKRRGEEREEKRHEEMENDMWPFYFSESRATISHPSFLLVSCLPFSLSSSISPSSSICVFSSCYCLNKPTTAETREETDQ